MKCLTCRKVTRDPLCKACLVRSFVREIWKAAALGPMDKLMVVIQQAEDACVRIFEEEEEEE